MSGKLFAALVVSGLLAASCGGGSALVTPRPAVEVAGNQPAGGSDATNAPATSAAPTSRQDPGATGDPSGEPVTPPTSADVVGIEFGRDLTFDGSKATLLKPADRFKLGADIAWRVKLPSAANISSLLVEVVDQSGAVVATGNPDPAARGRLLFGSDLGVGQSGAYTLRLVSDGVIVALGDFSVREATGQPTPTPAPTPGPTRTPKPTRPPTQAPVAPTEGCDSSYPTVCIPPPPPDLDCADVPFVNFKVRGADPHNFDGDHDGIGCESGGGSNPDPDPTPTHDTGGNNNGNRCDPSYPDVCIPSGPPDLDCGDIPFRNFRVIGADYHGFDGDNDGRGCES